MTCKTSIIVLAIAWPYCVKEPPDWYLHQDRSIKMPDFHDPAPAYVVDGAELQAIRVATDDFLPASTAPTSCAYTQAAHLYQIIRRDDIIFVRITANPRACGGQGYALDGAGRYAISTDGRILRRILDTEPEGGEGEDAGLPLHVIELPARPDGGIPVPEIGFKWNERYLPRWLLDGGRLDDSPDAGGTAPLPDAGAAQPM